MYDPKCKVQRPGPREVSRAAKETEGDTVSDCAAIATTKTFESARVAVGFALRSLGFVDNEFEYEYDTGVTQN